MWGSRKPVLNNVSLDVHKGQKIAIVGQSGGGKTTLAKLCLGLWTPETGKISINGMDIQEVDNQALRQAIAYVPQNVELFSGSVIENIKLGKPDATYEQVKLACKKAGCSSFIESLPAKFETHLVDKHGKRIDIVSGMLSESHITYNETTWLKWGWDKIFGA